MQRPTLSPEARVLLLTAGDSRTGIELRRLVETGLSWPRLCWLADWENAAPVLSQRVAWAEAKHVPPTAASYLRKLVMAQDFRTSMVERRLKDVLDLFATHRIEALLTGVACVNDEGNPFQRPVAGVEILVPADRLNEAVRITGNVVTSRGVKGPGIIDVPTYIEGPAGDPPNLAVAIQTSPFRGAGRHPFQLSTEALWREARPARLNGSTVLVPDAHDQLVLACLQFVWLHRMAFGAWRTFRDVRTLVESGRIDWDRLVPMARERRAATCCYWTLRLAGALSQVDIPPAVLESLRPRRSTYLLGRLECHFALELLPSETLCPSPRLGQRMWELGVGPRQSGHGALRPWHEAEPVPARERIAGGGTRRRWGSRLQQLRASAGYLGRILLAQEGADTPPPTRSFV